MQITKNFSLSEFQSKDGAEMPESLKANAIRLAENLQVIRNKIQCPLHINSAYRSPEHNKRIGGVKNSQHVLAKASDLTSRCHSPKQLYKIIKNLIDLGEIDQGGLGLYSSFVHYDIRGTEARWKK